jgi:hypothetical protein
VDASEKISGELVVTCCDSSKVLEFVEEALDEVAFAIEGEVTRQWKRAAGVGRNDRGNLPVGQGFDEGIGIVGLVAYQGRRIEILKQRFCTGEIAGLAWREHQLHGIAQRIDERMNFGAQSAA